MTCFRMPLTTAIRYAMATPLSAADPLSADTQEAVFNLLGGRATYGPGLGNRNIQRHQTHAAVVFLAGDRALKVKRAVRYPFLDYSTLGKRKAACEAELEVNRRFAPQLYRGVVPITREADGSLALNGVGEPIEWAVEMARFDENRTLDHLAERDELDDTLLGKLAVAVAAMHDRAEPVDDGPWIGALERFIRNNSSVFRKHGGLFPAQTVSDLEHQSISALARLRPLLAQRGRQGLVRRGHGDLHLRNIAVIDNEPVAFDALEFDPVIASGDLLYDLAFLLMDLVETGHAPAANRVLNGYFVAARRPADCDGIAALPFFMSLRAAIRAMATASRLDVAKSDVAMLARRYFDLALELLKRVKPAIVGVGGLSGTGKSLLAQCLAPSLMPAPGALIFRSDVERKAFYGLAETEHLPGEAYRLEVTARIYRMITDKAARVAKAGYSAIVDAVFAKSEERTAIETAATALGVDFHGLFLVADLKTRLDRVGARKRDASDADDAVVLKQQALPIGAVTWIRIDTSGSPEQTLDKARTALK
jgi:aminoglycoside phosphotransferase family enzyme/predicted kinase